MQKVQMIVMAAAALVILLSGVNAADADELKTNSVFFSDENVARLRGNIERYDWARAARDRIVERARPWCEMSDEALWGLMFGPTLTRSWVVWSGGHCPSCKESVPMYNWVIDSFKRPWKVACPHCDELFPKNDFKAFYDSGLGPDGVFDPKLADRKLLFNTEHPGAADRLRTFGVDDGEGFEQDGKRWRFIGCYLIYGEWKQKVIAGIRALAVAYLATGDQEYSRKAGILLDRVADIYPTFDYATQGLNYERKGTHGYVSVWHDSCQETRKMVLAYDQVFNGLKNDKKLIDFLSAKAKKHNMENSKQSFADIQRNIEERILRDAMANRRKISDNYPRREIAVAVINTVLNWPENRPDVEKLVDKIITTSTRVDGVTGEQALAGYAANVLSAMSAFFNEFDRLDPQFLNSIFEKYPVLHQSFRFHLDTWCLEKYYPYIGDDWYFAGQITEYQGVLFSHPWAPKTIYHDITKLEPSPYTFLWRLYQHTGDAAFAQVLYNQTDGQIDGFPDDLLADDPVKMQRQLQAVIDEHGSELNLPSINKQQWCVAILRSGSGERARAAWITYDDGTGGHGHSDGMNLGLFAHGLDLMPELGYPQVQFGGWGSQKAIWCDMTAAHNTVIVDGKNHASGGRGVTTLWGDGEMVQSIRVSAPKLIEGKQYERTVATMSISEEDLYLFDVFRVIGGKDHAYFMHSHFAEMTITGLTLNDTEDYGHKTLMRNFKADPDTQAGWNAVWEIEDYYEYLPKGTPVHLKYTDLTRNATAHTCEIWMNAGTYEVIDEKWIPRLMIRRQSGAEETAPLASTFVGIYEPYGETSSITRIKRLVVSTPKDAGLADSVAAVEVSLADGRRDFLITGDPETAREAVLKETSWELTLDGDTAMVRADKKGAIKWLAAFNTSSIKVGEVALELKQRTDFIELQLKNGSAKLVSGDADSIKTLKIGGKSVKLR